MAGFIDSLTALAAHMGEREAFEASVRRAWSRMAFYCALLIPMPVFASAFVNSSLAGAPTALSTVAALVGAGVLTAGLACALFLATAASPWRAAPDSVDRVTLRHEDSPLRDRIRISQWILFDSVLSRFAFHHRRVNAVISQGVMAVSMVALFSIAMVSPLVPLLGAASVAREASASVALVLFLILVLGAIVAVSRTTKGEFHLAQHYARQVLAFDDDFGGFLPRAEKDRVEAVANARAGGAPAPAQA